MINYSGNCNIFFSFSFSIGDYFYLLRWLMRLRNFLRLVFTINTTALFMRFLSWNITASTEGSLFDIVIDDNNLLFFIIICTAVVLIVVFAVVSYFRISRMKKRINFDKITGYCSYSKFLENVNKVLCRNENHQYAMISCDITKFKLINDLYGHDEGNRILKMFADTLNNTTHEDEHFGRMYADNFILFIRYLGRDDLERRFAEAAMEYKKLQFKNNFVFAIKSGIYRMEPGDTDVEKAINRASYARESLKDSFASSHAYYGTALHDKISKEKEIENDMETALNEHQFVAYYQPKVDIIDGKIIGAEALVRWIHPIKGRISPGDFIPYFEKTGFVVKLDMYIFEAVCKQLHSWIAQKHPIIPISCNLSRKNFADPMLCERLYEMTQKYEVPTGLIELELTETIVMSDMHNTVLQIKRLRNMGFKVSIDDFGSGYSSITLLQSTPIDVLKLDKEFVDNGMSTEMGQELFSNIVYICKKNQLRVVCEGIENKEYENFIAQNNCRFAQGFLYYKPLPIEELEKHVKKFINIDDNALYNLRKITKQKQLKQKIVIADSMPEHIEQVQALFNNKFEVIPCATITECLEILDEFSYEIVSVIINTNSIFGKSMMEWMMECNDSGYTSRIPFIIIGPEVLRADYGKLFEYGVFDIVDNNDYDEAFYQHIMNTAHLIFHHNYVNDYVSRQNDTLEMDYNLSKADMESSTTNSVYMNLLNDVPCGIFKASISDNKIVYANNFFYRLFGYTRKQAHKVNFDTRYALHPSEIAHVKALMTDDSFTSKRTFELTLKAYKQDGDQIWILVRCTSSYLSKNVLIGTVYDITEQKESEEQTRIWTSMYKMASALSDNIIYHYNYETRAANFLEKTAELFGVPTIYGTLPEQAIADGLVAEESIAEYTRIHEEIMNGANYAQAVCKLYDKNHNTHWYSFELTALPDEYGISKAAVVVCTDITIQKEREIEYQKSRDYYELIMNRHIVTYGCNFTKGIIEVINGNVPEQYHGDIRTSYEDTVTNAVNRYVLEEYKSEYQRVSSVEYLKAEFEKGNYSLRFEHRRHDNFGKIYWAARSIVMNRDTNTGDLKGIVSVENIDNERNANTQFTNTVSDNFNRSSFIYLLEEWLEKAHLDKLCAFMVITINQFQSLTKSIGGAALSKILSEISQGLKRVLRATDLAASFGGDEFIVCLGNMTAKVDILNKAEQVMHMFNEAVRECEYRITCNIGISLFPLDGTSFDNLYRKANIAAYEAKQIGENQIVIYNPSIKSNNNAKSDSIEDEEKFATLMQKLRPYGVNSDNALLRFVGNKGLYLKFANKFLYETSFHNFEKHYLDKEFDTVIRDITILKGLASNLSFTILYNNLNKFMNLIREQKYNELADVYSCIEQDYKLICKAISEVEGE